MGTWYGMAKRREAAGDEDGSKRMRVRALVIPALLHGFYDFTASRQTTASSILFIIFVIVMFVTAYRLVKHVAANDRYIRNYSFGIIRNNSADPK
jgi:RsiW-degrading membrane proteinase PrsW (M82 family)